MQILGFREADCHLVDCEARTVASSAIGGTQSAAQTAGEAEWVADIFDTMADVWGKTDMTDANITQEIIDQLSDARDPNDIILAVCDKYGLSWPEAEALVLKVQRESHEAVTLRQAPLLTVVALATFAVGAVILLLGIYPLLLAAIAVLQTGESGKVLNSWEFYFAVSTMVHTGLHPLVAIPLGATMMLGSLIGMQDVWAALLPGLKAGSEVHR